MTLNALCIMVPVSVTVCIGLWRMVRRVETPVSELVHEIQNTVKAGHLLIEQVQKSMESVNVVVQDVDKAIISANIMINDMDKALVNANEMIVDIREPVKRMLVTTEETVRNVDNVMDTIQLHTLKKSISNMGSSIFNVLLCRRHLKDATNHEKTIDKKIMAKVALHHMKTSDNKKTKIRTV